MRDVHITTSDFRLPIFLLPLPASIFRYQLLCQASPFPRPPVCTFESPCSRSKVRVPLLGSLFLRSRFPIFGSRFPVFRSLRTESTERESRILSEVREYEYGALCVAGCRVSCRVLHVRKARKVGGLSALFSARTHRSICGRAPDIALSRAHIDIIA